MSDSAPRAEGRSPPDAQRRYRAVVVDDEPAGRAAVTTFLTDVAAVEVVGEAADGGEAIELVERTRPDLLFLDIQMPDRDGFAVLDALGDAVPRGVVLVTAHGEYARRAFDVHAVDYVTKPFGRPRFMAAVERALRRLTAEEALDVSRTLRSLVESLRIDAESGREGVHGGALVEPNPEAVPSSTPSRPIRIGVRMGTRTTLVDVHDIDWVEADGDLVRLHVGERVHLLQARMHELESMLDSARFLRIHRSTIVNLHRVQVLHRDPDGGGSVALDTGVQLRVARSRWQELEEALGLEGGG